MSTSFSQGCIIKVQGEDSLFEVTAVYGDVVLARPVKDVLFDSNTKSRPIQANQCEMVMEAANATFNILFNDE